MSQAENVETSSKNDNQQEGITEQKIGGTFNLIFFKFPCIKNDSFYNRETQTNKKLDNFRQTHALTHFHSPIANKHAFIGGFLCTHTFSMMFTLAPCIFDYSIPYTFSRLLSASVKRNVCIINSAADSKSVSSTPTPFRSPCSINSSFVFIKMEAGFQSNADLELVSKEFLGTLKRFDILLTWSWAKNQRKRIHNRISA